MIQIHILDANGKVSLKECSCIPKDIPGNETSDPFGTATTGNCAPEESCKNWKMYPFLAIFALLLFPMISTTTPTVQASLRTVPPDVKSVALGIQVSNLTQFTTLLIRGVDQGASGACGKSMVAPGVGL